MRPVRRVQVPTHFEEVDLKTTSLGTPPPPAMEAAIIKEIRDVGSTENAPVSVPAARDAVYARRPLTPPADINTLVPEDFSFDEFEFLSSLKKPDDSKPVTSSTENATADTPSAAAPEHVASTSSHTDGPLLLPAAKTDTAVNATAATLPESGLAVVPVVHAASVTPPPVPTRTSMKPLVDTQRKSTATTDSGVIMDFSDAEVEGTSSTMTEKQKDAAVQSPAAAPPETDAVILAPPPPAPSETVNQDRSSVRESKQAMLPVLPIAEPATKAPEPLKQSPPSTTSNVRPSSVLSGQSVSKRASSTGERMMHTGPSAAEMETLKRQLAAKQQDLDHERDEMATLSNQIAALTSRSDAQEEALTYKNERIDRLEADFLRLNNDLTSLRNEKDRLATELARASDELERVSETNAKAFIEKSDEIAALKEQLEALRTLLAQKDREMETLRVQLEESKQTHMATALSGLDQYTDLDDAFIQLVTDEIKKLQETIAEETAYNDKLQAEVDVEYAFWKRNVAEHVQSEDTQ